MVRERVIWVKFFTPGYPQNEPTTFSINRFFTILVGHLEFLHNMQQHIYLGNGVRWSDFDKMFDPPGIYRFNG